MISTHGTMAAVRGIVLNETQAVFACLDWWTGDSANSGLNHFSGEWALPGEVIIAKRKHSDADLDKLKKSSMADVVSPVTIEDIPSKLMFNCTLSFMDHEEKGVFRE